MLHFLISLALCIFIGERLVHYYWIMKLRRLERREERRIEAMLYPPPPRPIVQHIPWAQTEGGWQLRRAAGVVGIVLWITVIIWTFWGTI